MKDISVIPRKKVVSQHCLLVINILYNKDTKHQTNVKSKIKLWKLKDSEVEETFKRFKNVSWRDLKVKLQNTVI